MTTDMTRDDTWLELPDAPAIDGLRFRRGRTDDGEWDALAELIVAANRHDDIPWLPSGRMLRDEWAAEEGTDMTADTVVAEVHGRVVAEAGVARIMREARPTYSIEGHVLPEFRRRGLGRALLRENARRARERTVTEDVGFEPADIGLHAFAEEREAGNRALLDAEGFAPVRWFFLMRRSLADPIPDVPLPDGLELRPVRPEDHRRIVEAEHEAFRDHWQSRDFSEHAFDQTFRKSDVDTGLWVVAWDGDEVAGVVQNWIWADENANLGTRYGWLEHISVRRPWRRRGLGRAITAESLRRLRAAGMEHGMLGVDAENPTGALGLYEGLGFEVQRRSTAYSRSLAG
jgi:mycothiol synthase